MENASDAVRCIVYGITVYGNGEILTPPHKINTPEPIDKTFGTTDYVRNGSSYTKFGRNPSTGGFWENGWNITKIIFIYLYLYSLISLQVRLVDGFLRAIKDVKSLKDVPFCSYKT